MSNKNKILIPSYLESFSSPGVNALVESGAYQKILPTNSISEGAPIEFHIPSLNQCVIALSDTTLVTKFRILDKENKTTDVFTVEDDKFYGICNSFLTTMWSDVSIDLNNVHIIDYNSLFPFVAHFENLFSDANLKKVEMAVRGFVDESAASASDRTSAAFIKRAALTSGSKVCTLVGPLNSSFFMERKTLPANTSLQIKLTPASNKFALMSKTECKLDIISVELLVKYLKLETSLIISHLEYMKNNNFLMQFISTKPKMLLIPSGIQSINFPNIFNGVLPSRLIFTLIAQKNAVGDYENSPLDFNHFGLKSFKLTINNKIIPSTKLDFSFSEPQDYFELYYFSHKNLKLTERSSYIDVQKYEKGQFFIACDLTADGTGNSHLNVKETGVINLSLDFNTNLKQVVNLLLIPTYPSTLNITKEGQSYIEI